MEYQPATNRIPAADVTHIMIKYTIPYCLYLEDGSITVVIDSRPAYITHQMITSDIIRGFPPDIRVPHISRLRHDRWGRQSFTLVSISLPRHSWPDGFEPEDGNQKLLVGHSLRYINKLIHTYKFIAGEFLCDELTEIDIAYYEYLYLNSTKKEFERSILFFPFGNALMSGHATALYDSDIYKKIQSFVQVEYRFSPVEELSFNANSFLLKGQYGLAALFAAQSFESFCKAAIKQGYLKQGTKTSSQIDSLLEQCSFFTLLRDHMKTSTGLDFGATKEFSDWNTVIRPIRNALAHGENPAVSKNDAENIISIINNATKWLQQNL